MFLLLSLCVLERDSLYICLLLCLCLSLSLSVSLSLSLLPSFYHYLNVSQSVWSLCLLPSFSYFLFIIVNKAKCLNKQALLLDSSYYKLNCLFVKCFPRNTYD